MTDDKPIMPLAPSPEAIVQARYDQQAKRVARKELKAKRAKRKAQHAASIEGY